ncbi:hypothetical protein IC229_32165 [Spirosoma sp. BT702]|uniref:Uncharacterized protein n=1 Tax=Spirosoma profusum TaxID=2771354 RepID=A0A927AVQ1_9BACT|nr:hypothetical protein [Spirosoma profusum]MBD2705318.1 hypothetical protein [Spirosoma profusum]
MNNLLTDILLVTVVLLASCKNDINSLQTGCTGLEPSKNILGTWQYTSRFTSNKRHQFSGTISFNRDSSISDPDSLLGFSYGLMPVIKKYYNVTDDMLKIYQVTKIDTLLMEGKMELYECNKMIYSGWPNSSIPDYNLKLTLTR